MAKCFRCRRPPLGVEGEEVLQQVSHSRALDWGSDGLEHRQPREIKKRTGGGGCNQTRIEGRCCSQHKGLVACMRDSKKKVYLYLGSTCTAKAQSSPSRGGVRTLRRVADSNPGWEGRHMVPDVYRFHHFVFNEHPAYFSSKIHHPSTM